VERVEGDGGDQIVSCKQKEEYLYTQKTTRGGREVKEFGFEVHPVPTGAWLTITMRKIDSPKGGKAVHECQVVSKSIANLTGPTEKPTR